jgi:hypothetical protein
VVIRHLVWVGEQPHYTLCGERPGRRAPDTSGRVCADCAEVVADIVRAEQAEQARHIPARVLQELVLSVLPQRRRMVPVEVVLTDTEAHALHGNVSGARARQIVAAQRRRARRRLVAFRPSTQTEGTP